MKPNRKLKPTVDRVENELRSWFIQTTGIAPSCTRDQARVIVHMVHSGLTGKQAWNKLFRD